MALLYVMSVSVLILCVVNGHVIFDSSLEGTAVSDSGTGVLLRVKRTIMKGTGSGNGCAIGAVRHGYSCLSCDEIGKRRGRSMKFCNEKCISTRRQCLRTTGNRKAVYA